ncbi:MAG: NTP transferase domain-containing protein [Dehalococcoidia bacterium]|jgi:choline kinase|nr:NTP transferase domain-containing protein [Chloroflexota bacterium]MCK4241997.1 NTP transferase domain-containing protein [Dehalococcoidia bacterium]MCK4263126.1 NTP transferase domain-containing protein [Dehalococcoidia bacterium]
MGVIRSISKGVVLAAGDGGRLRALSSTCPKVLLPVRGKPLICHSIEAMATAGIREIAVVIGYRGSQVRAALGDGSRFDVRLDYILNSDYQGGNAISLKKVKPWAAGEPFVLCMGDHIIEPAFVSRLLGKSAIAETLCVDFAPAGHHQFAEATKVVVDSSGCIKRIGKGLAYWNAIDTGVFLLTGKFLDAIDELIPVLGIDIEISDVIRFLVGRCYRFATCDVSGCFWADVDTEEDLDFVTA